MDLKKKITFNTLVAVGRAEAFRYMKNRCQERLEDYYAAGIPEPAQEWLDEKLEFLRDSYALDDFLLFSELSDIARRGGFLFSLMGWKSGTMPGFLLGNQRINPLPAHYYCGQCGYFEQKDSVTFGLDLPDKICPQCGSPLRRDGFHICIESAWENTPDFECRIPEMFAPFATCVIERHFLAQGRETLPLTMYYDSSDENKIRVHEQDGVAVLPAGKVPKDYSDWLCCLSDGRIGLEYNWEVFKEQGLKRILLPPSDDLTHIYRLQQAFGVFEEEIRPQRVNPQGWRDILNSGVPNRIYETVSKMHPKSFEETVNAFLIPFESFADQDSHNCLDISELLDMPELQNCPCFSRDDIFDFLVRKGFPGKKAFEVSEYIGKGRGFRLHQKMSALELPAELEAIVGKIKYLWPRYVGVDMVLRQLVLSEYMRMAPAAYCRIRFAGRK